MLLLLLPLTAVLQHNLGACVGCEFARGEGKDRRCSESTDEDPRTMKLSVRGACPKGFHESPPRPVPHDPAAPRPRLVTRDLPGREPFWKLWSELHTRPRDGWDGGDDLIWLYLFVTRIPCGECRREYLAWLAGKPIDFTRGPGHYFEQTVEFHNHVNRRRGRPVWSVPEARAMWGY